MDDEKELSMIFKELSFENQAKLVAQARCARSRENHTGKFKDTPERPGSQDGLAGEREGPYL